MTPQEQDLIAALLNRLKAAGTPPKDAEADALIRRGMAEQPDAPYLLVQTVLMQDMALHNAQTRLTDLEHQIAEAKNAAPQQQAPSFLGGAGHGSVPSAGPWGRPAPAPAASAPVWTQSSGASPQPAGYAQPGFGQPGSGQPAMGPLTAPSATSGFLRQAATTAAGIAGGALLFQGIQSLFGHHMYGGAYGGMLGGMPMQPGLSETVVNNYYGDQGAPGGMQQADYPADPGLMQADAGQDPGGQQDYASDQDFGGQQDYGGQDFASDQDFGGNDDFSSDV